MIPEESLELPSNEMHQRKQISSRVIVPIITHLSDVLQLPSDIQNATTLLLHDSNKTGAHQKNIPGRFLRTILHHRSENPHSKQLEAKSAAAAAVGSYTNAGGINWTPEELSGGRYM